MLNDYLWQLYLDAGGQEVVDMFERNLTEKFSEEYLEAIYTFRNEYCPDQKINLERTSDLSGIITARQNGDVFIGKKRSIKTGMNEVYRIFKKNPDNKSEKDIYWSFACFMDFYTTAMAAENPELFVPYHFVYSFNMLELIADEFGIDLPPVPPKRDYKKRFYYYGELCEAFKEFRKANDLSPYEFFAFLYDFAPKYVGGLDSFLVSDLPEPKSAYFIGGNKDDKGLVDNPTITAWQCNPETRPGDIIVMYMTSPDSAVKKIWRSISPGFNDPFFYYYRCTYIANPEDVKAVPLQRLKKDKIFKNVPLVRKNMQGVNGVEIKPSEYNHLLDMAKAKKSIPRLEAYAVSNDDEFINEKDVEDKLIKPFLKKLGYSETDYDTQLVIGIGNNNTHLIPDFVLQKKMLAARIYTAPYVLEAKRSITNKKDLEAARDQVRSYAKELSSRLSVVASQEGIWIYSEASEFFDEVFKATWKELANPDIYSECYKLIGKDAV